jgi:hypothetical protein
MPGRPQIPARRNRLLCGGLRFNRERVHAALEFIREEAIYDAVALDPALPGERRSNNPDAEVGSAAGFPAGMAGVLMGFVDDIEVERSQALLQFRAYLFLNVHLRA